MSPAGSIRRRCLVKGPAVSKERNGEFLEAVRQAKLKCGTAPLSDEDQLLLAFEEISRTVTYEELHYGTGQSCAD